MELICETCGKEFCFVDLHEDTCDLTFCEECIRKDLEETREKEASDLFWNL